MAIALSSSTCFDAVSNALQAVKHGKATEAAIILHSVKNDAELMQNELRKYHRRLQRTERQYEEKAEQLTRKMNDLYQEEQKLRKQERELRELIPQLHSEIERNTESRNEAEMRFTQASDEEQRAGENRELHEALLWIPIVNIFAAETIKKNDARARQAREDMETCQRRIYWENNEIRNTNIWISNIHDKIPQVQREAQSLKQQRDSCHDELGAVKSITVFVLDARYVSSLILNLTEEATVKTENLERIMGLAAKKNTLKIFKSGGIKTKVGSFKVCWDEIVEMMQSNSLIYFDEDEHEISYLLIVCVIFVLLVLNYVVLKVKSIFSV